MDTVSRESAMSMQAPNLPEDRQAVVRRILPVIDLAAARGNDPAAKRQLAQQFDHAFSTSGFCYVVNYGLPPSVVEDILRMIALALGIDENLFRDRYGDDQDTSLGVLAFYPSLTPADVTTGKQSLLAHCDYSCITLLVQDQTGGLQVQERSSGQW